MNLVSLTTAQQEVYEILNQEPASYERIALLRKSGKHGLLKVIDALVSKKVIVKSSLTNTYSTIPDSLQKDGIEIDNATGEEVGLPDNKTVEWNWKLEDVHIYIDSEKAKLFKHIREEQDPQVQCTFIKNLYGAEDTEMWGTDFEFNVVKNMKYDVNKQAFISNGKYVHFMGSWPERRQSITLDLNEVRAKITSFISAEDKSGMIRNIRDLNDSLMMEYGFKLDHNEDDFTLASPDNIDFNIANKDDNYITLRDLETSEQVHCFDLVLRKEDNLEISKEVFDEMVDYARCNDYENDEWEVPAHIINYGLYDTNIAKLVFFPEETARGVLVNGVLWKSVEL